MATWKDVDFDSCPNCGDALECLTNCDVIDGIQHFLDGDDVRCLGECGVALSMSCSDGDAWVSWDNEQDMED